jgi:hypothetical protein
MSFVIKLKDDELDTFLEYEKELIRTTAKMNCIWIDYYKPDSLCLTCFNIRYKNDGTLNQIEHISQMIDRGFGKCDSIVAWYMAVYSYYDVESEPVLTKRSEDELHAQLAIIKNGNRIVIDPSLTIRKLDAEFCNACSKKRRF